MTIIGPENPAYLTISPDGRDLYTTWEVPEWPEGLISAYAINGGGLSYRNVRGSADVGPAYLSVDSQNRFCFASNYASGEVAVFPIGPNGDLGETVSVITQSGSGPDPERQTGPHPHCMVAAPDDRFVLAADLGADVVVSYEVNYVTGELEWRGETAVPPGSGPRHLVFHPGGLVAYLTCELTSQVAVFGYKPESGSLSWIGEHSTLPADFAGESFGADIQIHPSGRWIYASNRGHDSLAVFEVGGGGGLSPRGWRSTDGATPRNFTISPDGAFLLVGNQDSDNITVLAIDPNSGIPTDVVSVCGVPTPACLKFAP